MPLLTVVEQYVMAAMLRAQPDILDDGTVVATIRECPGIVASGADRHECTVELFARLEEWIRVSLTNGQRVPVIDGIDLNAVASQIVTGYHQNSVIAEPREFYEDEHALEAAFTRMDALIDRQPAAS